MNSNKGPEESGLPWAEIVSSAVHDMRTPLSSMRTTLEIVRMLNSQSEKTTALIDKLDKQVLEIAACLERLQRDPSSDCRPAAPEEQG